MIIDINETVAFIKSNPNLFASPLEFEPVDLQIFLNLIHEIPPFSASGEQGQFGLVFPRLFQFKNSNVDNSFDLPISNVPSLNEFFEVDISEEIEVNSLAGIDYIYNTSANLISIGGPEFESSEYENISLRYDEYELDINTFLARL